MIDPTSAWLGALFAVAAMLALIVAGGASVLWVGRGWVAAFLDRFRTFRLDRVGGQVQVTTAFVEPLERERRHIRLLPSSSEDAPRPEAAE